MQPRKMLQYKIQFMLYNRIILVIHLFSCLNHDILCH